MNAAQKALLAQLRELIAEVPTSGAVNRGGRTLYLTRFAPTVERYADADDGDGLVAYIRTRIRQPETATYGLLVAAGHPEMTVEAVVGDADADWSPCFTDEDRAIARDRLGAQVAAHRDETAAAEAAEVERVVARRNEMRAAKGKLPLTAEQIDDMVARRAR